jgi:hypothetical protein
VKLPTERQARGYDCLIWIDEEGDVVCRAYTDAGTKFLQQMDKRYEKGDVLEIITHPEEFKKHIPPMLKIGSISPNTKKVSRMVTQGLQ